MFNKLKEFGKSFIWLLGAVILLAQTYRIVAFYAFDLEFEIDLVRDFAFAILGFAMMFIQNGLKSAALKVIKRKSDSV
jgi:hypothetical protein